MTENSPTIRDMARRFMVGAGPLKRTSDRLQFCSRVLLLMTLLTALPVGMAVGTATYTDLVTVADAQAAERHEVTAVLAAGTPLVIESQSGTVVPTRATVTWTGPAGDTRSGQVDVLGRRAAGTTVPIWLDHQGRLAPKPLAHDDVSAHAFGNGLITFLWIGVLAATAHLLLRSALDRHRMRRWEQEWVVAEAQWTGGTT